MEEVTIDKDGWEAWILGKTGYEVFKAISQCVKSGKWPEGKTKTYSDKIWKLHKQLNEAPEIKERKKQLDRLF